MIIFLTRRAWMFDEIKQRYFVRCRPVSALLHAHQEIDCVLIKRGSVFWLMPKLQVLIEKY